MEFLTLMTMTIMIFMLGMRQLLDDGLCLGCESSLWINSTRIRYSKTSFDYNNKNLKNNNELMTNNSIPSCGELIIFFSLAEPHIIGDA